MEEADIANSLQKLIAGSEFERKLEAVLERKLASGMTEAQILAEAGKAISDIGNASEDEEREIDPDSLTLDEELKREYVKLMDYKLKSPE